MKGCVLGWYCKKILRCGYGVLGCGVLFVVMGWGLFVVVLSVELLFSMWYSVMLLVVLISWVVIRLCCVE